MADDSDSDKVQRAAAWALREEARRYLGYITKQEVTCASAQAIPRAADKRWLARSVADAIHRLSAEQDDFLDRFCNEDEKNLATQGTYLGTAGIFNFIISFPYVLLLHRKGGSNVIPGMYWDFRPPFANLKIFWTIDQNVFCHFAIQTGRARGKHMVGISICKTRRIIYFYDSKKCWGNEGGHQKKRETHSQRRQVRADGAEDYQL